MCKCILNILDIKNLLGMRRPIPAYPQDEFVFRTNGSQVDLTFFVGNDTYLTYISGGATITNTYPSSGSAYNQTITADAGTDAAFSGVNANNLIAIGITNGITFMSFNRSLQVPVVPVSSLKTMDLRNMYGAMYNADIEVTNNIRTLYAVANTTDHRDICVTYINYSTVTNGGVLWIDKTQAYANDVIAAAQAKGWRVYGL